jgi:hypothetical protein
VPPSQLVEVSALAEERRMRCTALDAAGADFRYWIVGGWRRGMQYAVAPTIENWQRYVAEIATQQQADVLVRVHKTETVTP